MTSKSVPVMWILLIVLVGVMSLGPVAVMQEDEPTLAATVQPPTAEVPVEEPAEEPPPVVIEEPGGVSGLFSGVIGFVVGAAVGGFTALMSALTAVAKLKDNTPAQNTIEYLYKSIPADAPILGQLNQLGRTMRDAGEVLDKVTDGLPNALASNAGAPTPASRPVPPGREWLNEGG